MSNFRYLPTFAAAAIVAITEARPSYPWHAIRCCRALSSLPDDQDQHEIMREISRQAANALLGSRPYTALSIIHGLALDLLRAEASLSTCTPP
jgi:hypothetical protein